VTSLIVTPDEPPLCYLVIGGRLYRSTDRGDAWREEARSGLPSDAHINSVTIDYQHPETMYAATTQGIYRRQGEGAWELVNTLYARTLAVDLQDSNLLWAGVFWRASDMDAVIVKSEDGGRIWGKADYGIELGGVAEQMLVDPKNPNVLWASAAPARYEGESTGPRWNPTRAARVFNLQTIIWRIPVGLADIRRRAQEVAMKLTRLALVARLTVVLLTLVAVLPAGCGRSAAPDGRQGVGRVIVRDELIAPYPFWSAGGLLAANREATLSPDGRKVAYLPDVQGARSVVVRTLSSGQERNLTPAPGYQYLCLRWSPDSRSLALAQYGDQEGQDAATELWRADVDSGNLQLLYRQEAPEGVRGVALWIRCWSPGGRYLEANETFGNGPEPPALLIRTDGQDATGGTPLPRKEAPSAAQLGLDPGALNTLNQPLYDPTGAYALVVARTDGVRERPRDAPAGGDSLLLYDLKAQRPCVLASFPGHIYFGDIRVSPDGEWIAFVVEEKPNEAWSYWFVRRDGTGLRQVEGLNAGSFLWGAPGRAYLATPAGQALGSVPGALYELDLESGARGLVADPWPAQHVLSVSRAGDRFLVIRGAGESADLRWLELAPRAALAPEGPPSAGRATFQALLHRTAAISVAEDSPVPLSRPARITDPRVVDEMVSLLLQATPLPDVDGLTTSHRLTLYEAGGEERAAAAVTATPPRWRALGELQPGELAVIRYDLASNRFYYCGVPVPEGFRGFFAAPPALKELLSAQLSPATPTPAPTGEGAYRDDLLVPLALLLWLLRLLGLDVTRGAPWVLITEPGVRWERL